jgi:hypothetical protein
MNGIFSDTDGIINTNYATFSVADGGNGDKCVIIGDGSGVLEIIITRY